MPKHYPPIFNVVILAVIFCLILANPMAILMPWLVDIHNTIISICGTIITMATNGLILIGSAIVCAFNTYTIFTIHVVIITLYVKQLFGKDAKTRYQTAMDTFESYNNHTCDRTEATITLGHHFVPLYVLTCCVLFLIMLNIAYPNIYRFTILQLLNEACDNIPYSNLMLFLSPFIGIILILTPIYIGLFLAEIKTFAMVGEGCVSAADRKRMIDYD